MADDVFVIREESPAVYSVDDSPLAVVDSGFSADWGRSLRTNSGQSWPEVDKTNFIAKYFAGDAVGNPVPSVGTVTGGDATLRTDLANPASGAALVGYQRSGGVTQSVYSFIVREKCTPLEYGAVGNGTADDTTAMRAAETSGKRVRLPYGFTFKTKGGGILPSNSQIEGDGGLIDFDASVSTWLWALGADGTSSNCSNIAIEGVRLTSASDIGFMHLVRLSNTGLIDHFQFEWNIIDYPVVPGNSNDRWVLASGGSGGTRTNIICNHNQVTGPMQLIASAVGGHTLKHASFSWNTLKNTRANAIAIVSLGGITGPNTGEDITVQGNDIYADTYTAVGIFLGIDQASTDKCIALRRIKVIGNTIKILGTQPDIFWRLGNKCANIGGFDSVADEFTIADNDIYHGIQIMQDAPATASGTSQATNLIIDNNRFHGGDINFAYLADGAEFKNNTAYSGANLRPSTNNGRIYSHHNTWALFSPLTANAEFTWDSSHDTYFGSTAGGADRVVTLNANAGKVQVANFKNPVIDSYTTGLRYNAISVNGAGAPTVTVRNLASSTTWVNGRYERVSGTIKEYTGDEVFSGGNITPGTLAPGQADTPIRTITVPGAALGDIVRAGYSLDLKGQQIVAYVSAANTVSYYIFNPAGNPAGTNGVGSGAVRVSVISKDA